MTMQFGAKVARALLSQAEKIVPVGPKDVEGAASICGELARRGIPSTLGYFHTHQEAPEVIVQQYRRASDLLHGCRDNTFYLSLKPWQLDYDPDALASIGETAISNQHGIHFDSLCDEVVDLAFDLLESGMGGRLPNVRPGALWQYGCTLPSRWRRSLEDADRAAENGMRVRVVKGEFAAEDPRGEVDPREGFLRLVESLAGRVPEIEIATHDYALARSAIIRSVNRGSSVQLGVLHNLPKRRMIALAQEMGIEVRVYVPYGDSLLYYAMKSFLKHPSKLRGLASEALVRGSA